MEKKKLLKQSIFRGIIAAVLFMLVTYLGNLIFHNDVQSIGIYLFEGLFFFVFMTPVYYFLDRRKKS